MKIKIFPWLISSESFYNLLGNSTHIVDFGRKTYLYTGDILDIECGLSQTEHISELEYQLFL